MYWSARPVEREDTLGKHDSASISFSFYFPTEIKDRTRHIFHELTLSQYAIFFCQTFSALGVQNILSQTLSWLN